jgi:hypothetical protein
MAQNMAQGPMLRVVAGARAEVRLDRRDFGKRHGELTLVEPITEPIAPVPKAPVSEEKRKLNDGLVGVSGHGFLGVMKEFLEKGADVNAADVYGRTALMKAAFGGHNEAVAFLLENKADVNAASEDGWTALMYASFPRHTGIMELLISKGADVNACDKEGKTVLEIVSRPIRADGKEQYHRARDILKRNGAIDYSYESADLV